jgi:hypothetical protein
VYATVAGWERLPLLPVTVTVYWPAAPLQESVEDPEPLMIAGERVQVRPDCEIVKARLTLPLKPLMGLIVTVEVLAAPAGVVTELGLV